MSLSIFLFLSELDTCLQILISTRGVEHEKKSFSARGYVEIQIQGHSLTIKKTYKKFFDRNSKQ